MGVYGGGQSRGRHNPLSYARHIIHTKQRATPRLHAPLSLKQPHLVLLPFILRSINGDYCMAEKEPVIAIPKFKSTQDSETCFCFSLSQAVYFQNKWLLSFK